MRKIVLTFGLIAGAILSAVLLITLPFQEQIGIEGGMVVGYTSMVLAFLMIFVGVKTYRDDVGGGTITLGRAFGVGLLIMAIAIVCYVATWELVFFQLDPSMADKMTTAAVESIKAKGLTAAETAKQTAEIEKFMQDYRQPLMNTAITFLEPLPVGLLINLVTAFALSRRRRTESLARA